MSMVMVERALEGSAARKFRAVLPDLGLKGEKAVTTEVMYLVIIVAVVVLWRERGGRESGSGGCDEMGMGWRRRRAEEPRQLQVGHLMRVHTSLNDHNLWTFITRPSIEYKDDTFLSKSICYITPAWLSRGHIRSTAGRNICHSGISPLLHHFRLTKHLSLGSPYWPSPSQVVRWVEEVRLPSRPCRKLLSAVLPTPR